MSYDPSIGSESDRLSCERQVALAKMIADQETSVLRHTIIDPACSRYAQIADRVKEHELTLGRSGIKINNSQTRVTPQVSILNYPQYNL